MKPKAMRRARAWLVLGGLFARELALSVKDVVQAVLRPSRVQRSGIVAVPLRVQGDTAIALLANLVTLTPGTTSLHVSDDKRVLYVHAMNLGDGTVAQIQSGFERRVKECLE